MTGDRTVLVVFHEEVLGGATLSVLRLVPLLEERNWRFVFWAPRPSSLFEELRGRSYEVFGEPRRVAYSVAALRHPPGLQKRLASLPRYFARLRRVLRAVEPTVVHANSLFTLGEALVARRQGCPTVLHVHEMVPSGVKFRLAQRVARRQLQELIAVSQSSADRLTVDDYRPRIVFEAAPVPSMPVALRQNPDPFVVGTVGVISHRKGSDLFIEAALRLRAEGVPIEFRMVGACTDVLEREWAERLIARARAYGVCYIPRVDAPAEMRGWDAFVLPSRRDPFPIAMLEAMASGLPVIGTRADGLAEQITPGSGVLVEPDDPAALARAIRWLAEQPLDVRAAMGAAARRRVQENFNLERQADGLHHAYESALTPAGGD